MMTSSSDSASAMILAAVSVGIASLALLLSVLQELRHGRENKRPIELDIRSMLLARGEKGVRLAVVDLVAFNPAQLGVALNHLQLVCPAHSEVKFDLAKPKRLSDGEWTLESTSYDTKVSASGELDFPYQYPPMNIPPRQAESWMFAFVPIGGEWSVSAPELVVAARFSSRKRTRVGLLWWRVASRRTQEYYDAVLATWNADFVSSVDVDSKSTLRPIS